MKHYRQGDLLFVQIDKLPPGATQVRPTGYIQEGEATGHIHRVAEADLMAAEVIEIGEGLFLSVRESGVSIIHNEHFPLSLPAGIYEVRRQREYSPEAIRNVAD